MPTKTPEIEIVTVTPSQAAEWLSLNTFNRPLRAQRVEEIAGAIQRGEWKLNGDAIRFATDGTLIDGQHRLQAVVNAGKSISSLVIRNLPKKVQQTIDTGARRNLKDTLALSGETDATNVAATVAYFWRYANGNVRMTAARPTIAQGLATLDENPGLRDAVKVAQRIRRRLPISVPMAATAYYTFSQIDQDAADDFFEKVISGAGLDERDPRFVLRRHLERQGAVGVGARASAVSVHALFIKAWNAYRDGRYVDGLNWKSTGARQESFPEPK